MSGRSMNPAIQHVFSSMMPNKMISATIMHSRRMRMNAVHSFPPESLAILHENKLQRKIRVWLVKRQSLKQHVREKHQIRTATFTYG